VEDEHGETRERRREDARGPGRLHPRPASGPRKQPGRVGNPDLDRYLEALAAVVDDLDGGFMNRGEAVPAQPSWELVAEILDMAKIHE
jgi:hypothetical protein